MKCTISATEPSILRDAKPGDLFVARDGHHDECVLAILHPCVPQRSAVSGQTTLIRCVVIGTRVEAAEPGYACAGTQLYLVPETAIQFVEQTQEAKFSERARKCDLKVRVHVVFGGGEGSNGTDSLRDAGEFTQPEKPGDQL